MHILLALLLPFVVSAASFPDTIGHPHAASIQVLKDHGIVSGYAGGIFRPDILLNRAEFLKIVMLAAFGEEEFDPATVRCFADFTGEEQWFWIYACEAKERGIVGGYPDGTFRGVQNVNMVEALKMSVEAFQIPLPVYIRQPDNWYDPYVDALSGRSVFTVLQLVPGHLLTRSEMAALIVALDEPLATVKPSSTAPTAPPNCGDNVLQSGEQCDDGNKIDGDGCSSLCISVPLPIRHAALLIDQRPVSVVDQTAGADDVPLLAFDALSGRQDAKLTGVKFMSVSGSLLNAENFTLYADTNGDDIADVLVGSASSQEELLSFANLAIQLTVGVPRRIELRGRMRESTAPTVLGVGFAVSQSRFIEAIGTEDARDLSGITVNGGECSGFSICWIDVQTQEPHIIGVGERGNLYVTKDTVPVPSRQLLGGVRSDATLRLRLYAEGEDIEVKEMRLGGFIASIDALELWEEGAAQPVATLRISQCPSGATGLICGSTAFTVAANTERRFSVRALMNADTKGAVSGQQVMLSLSPSVSGIVAIEAQGKSSQRDLIQNDGDGSAEGEIFIGRSTPGVNAAITGPAHDTVLAKIASITNVSPDAEGSAIPTGTTPIALFRFSAAAHSNSNGGLNQVGIDQLVFTVTASNVSVDSAGFALYNAADTSIIKSCTASAATGVITVTCIGLMAAPLSTFITQGSSLDLGLKATILNSQVTAGNSTLQVTLNTLNDRTQTGTVEWTDGDATFGWVDIGVTQVKGTGYGG